MSRFLTSNKLIAMGLAAVIAVAAFVAVPSAGVSLADASGNDASGNSSAQAQAPAVDPRMQQTLTVQYGGTKEASYMIDPTYHYASVYVAGNRVSTFYFRDAHGNAMPMFLGNLNTVGTQRYLGVVVGNPAGTAFNIVISDVDFNTLMGMGFSGISINGLPFTWVQLLQFRVAQ
ncbi:MAG: hypothetical protein Q4C60_05195 [Eubacteriales bacterium]|nr:hypothetical protein [Eubacteriales bacterium]